MMTQMQRAKAGQYTNEMHCVAQRENVPVEIIRDGIAKGRIVILKNNKNNNTEPVAIGEKLRTKVCARINEPNKNTSIEAELDKLRIVQSAEADVIIDYTSNRMIDSLRNSIISASKIPVGSIPMNQVAIEALKANDDLLLFEKDDIFSTIEKHCKDGCDFILLPCGLTKNLLDKFEKTKRVSKKIPNSALMLACWMKENGCENPLYEYFDDVLNILKEYDVTLVLSNVFSSFNTFDASDGIEVSEVILLSDLINKARENDVQVMIEGIEQASINKISMMVQNIKELTDFAPLFVNGAIACDSAVGYDNILSAIGGALACYQGANMLRAVADVDRIGFSRPAQIKEAIMSAKIAVHSADLASGHADTVKQNYKISYARANSHWSKQVENSFDNSVFEGMNPDKDANMDDMCLDYPLGKLYDKYFK